MVQGSPNQSNFVGRGAELAAVASSAEAAAGGRASVVWIEGAAGTGKSTFVREAVSALPTEFDVVKAEADELATDVFLAVASQFASLSGDSGFAAGLELLSAWSERQDHGPLAIVVEDLHWADIASQQALLTAARRLGDDRVLMIVTTRPNSAVGDGWERLALDPDKCRRIALGALTQADVGELARGHGLSLSRAQVARLWRHTAGHPLHAKTLLNELSPEQLASARGELPAPRSLASATVATLMELPAPSRSLLSALAVLGGRVPLATVGRVAGLDDPAPALEPLLRTGLVHWSPSEQFTPVEFAHPLYRTAVYDDMLPTVRRALHLAAADQYQWGPAWGHRVAAAHSVDDALADELEAGAQYEINRGDLPLAAKYLGWAAPLTSARDRADQRVLEAARLLLVAGETTRATELRERMQACRDTTFRDLVFGELAFAEGDAIAAARWLEGAIDSQRTPAADPTTLAEAMSQLAPLYSLHHRPIDSLEIAERGLRLQPTDPYVNRRLWAAYAIAAGAKSGSPAGVDALAPRLPERAADVAEADGDLLVTRGLLNMLSGRAEQAVTDLRAGIGMARRGHTQSQLPRAHIHLAQQLFFLGEWDEALAEARTVQSLVSDEDRPWMVAQAEATLSQVQACRGEWDLAETNLEYAIQTSHVVATLETTILAQLAVGMMARARNDPHGVRRAFEPLLDGDGNPTGVMTASIWWPSVIIAKIDTGDLDLARTRIEQLRQRSSEWHHDFAARIFELEARLAVAAGAAASGVALFAEALRRCGSNVPVLDQAELRHAYGRALLASGNRRLARDVLRAAHESFAGLGAEPFRLRIMDDLVAAGVHSAPNSSTSPLSLTDREQDIVSLVKKGMTNREVAAQIYVSEKAVEYHLRNVFRKLGISSRRELRRGLRSQGEAEGHPLGGASTGRRAPS